MDSHSGFARRKELPTEGAGKNGVLVPLPPWAKEPAAGAAEYYFCGGVPFCLPKKEPKMPRGLSPRSASTPVANPRPPLRGTLPWGCSAHPARAGQRIVFLSAPLPLAGQFGESLASWTGKARLVEAAVGAGLRDGRIVSAPTLDLWYFPGPVRTPAPTEKLPYLGRGRCLIGPPSTAGQTTWNWPGGPRRSETKFRRTFFAKLSFKKACREQRNPPPGRRNSSE